MIKFRQKGDFSKTQGFFEAAIKYPNVDLLSKYALEGVVALAAATPVDTGLTAASWDYEIEQTGEHTIIRWINTNIQNGINIAILLQYDHGTGTGGFVKGRDYINPAMKPVFDRIAEAVWKEVVRK